MTKRETDAIATILSDAENHRRSAEELAELVIDRLDELRARTHRLAVVGQIQWAPETAHTVVLGPFSCRGLLDTPEKFLKAAQGGSAARGAAEGLAWDSKTGTGRGRFMLAPAFMRPRDAWDFFRRPEPPDPRLTRITETIRRWEAGQWAEEASDGPACVCGLRGAEPCRRHQRAA